MWQVWQPVSKNSASPSTCASLSAVRSPAMNLSNGAGVISVRSNAPDGPA